MNSLCKIAFAAAIAGTATAFPNPFDDDQDYYRGFVGCKDANGATKGKVNFH